MDDRRKQVLIAAAVAAVVRRPFRIADVRVVGQVDAGGSRRWAARRHRDEDPLRTPARWGTA